MGASENETGHASASGSADENAIANASISAVATMKTTKAPCLVLARHVGNTDSAARRATILMILASGMRVTTMNGGEGNAERGDAGVSARRSVLIVMLWRGGAGRGKKRGLKRRSRLLRRRLRSEIASEIGMGIVGAGISRMRGVRRRM